MADAPAVNPIVSFACASMLVCGMLYLLEASRGTPASPEIEQAIEMPPTIASPAVTTGIPPKGAAGPKSLQENFVDSLGPRTNRFYRAIDAVAEASASATPPAEAAWTAIVALGEVDVGEALTSSTPEDSRAEPSAVVWDAAPRELDSEQPHRAASPKEAKEKILALQPAAIVGEPETPQPVVAFDVDEELIPQVASATERMAVDAEPPQVHANSASPAQIVVAEEAPASVSGEALQGERQKDVVVMASPPLPRRKPHPPSTVAAIDDGVPQRTVVESRGRPQPMSLGPAEESAKESSRGKAATPNLGNYELVVWSALARHKPRASQRGSATVSFGITGSGGLAFVRVSRSSGNAGLDQLALATIRGAAPFPSPPARFQSRPYVVRIDFP